MGSEMAKHEASSQSSPHMDMEAHRKTYQFFIKASIAGTIGCLYVLVALAAVAFASWGTLICWLALIIGTVLLVIDSMSGSSRWGLSMGGLAFFTLITLLNV